VAFPKPEEAVSNSSQGESHNGLRQDGVLRADAVTSRTAVAGRLAVEPEKPNSGQSGGHHYYPSTGGDSFTTMHWRAVPEERAELDDYLAHLSIVPDAQSFAEATKTIGFASGGYRIEITDPDNDLLEEEDALDDNKFEPKTGRSIPLWILTVLQQPSMALHILAGEDAALSIAFPAIPSAEVTVPSLPTSTLTFTSPSTLA
jgi:hypothetical protein